MSRTLHEPARRKSYASPTPSVVCDSFPGADPIGRHRGRSRRTARPRNPCSRGGLAELPVLLVRMGLSGGDDRGRGVDRVGLHLPPGRHHRTHTDPGGSYTTFTLPIWVVPLTQTPALVVLGLAIRELLLARREAQGSPLSPYAPHLSAEEAEDPSWTFLVQKAQQRITHAKNETDWSFPPILVGGFVFAELLIVNLLPSGALLFFVVLPLTGALLSVLFWLLYRVARRWIRGYQTL